MMANPALNDMFGYDPGQLAGKRVEELVPAATRKAHVGYRDAFFDTPGQKRPMSTVRDIRGIRRDGSEFHRNQPQRHGRRWRALRPGFGDDVTARRAVDLELERHRTQLENWSKNVRSSWPISTIAPPAATTSLDADGVFVNVNQTELDWLGYSRDEMIGRLRALDLIS